jgi:dienelactone hydrolase
VPFEPIALAAAVDGRSVPTLLYVPISDGPLPLVLLGHGAHQSKDDPIAQILAKAIARGVPAGVALMDAPGHGERRLVGSTDVEYERDVRRRMGDPDGDRALVQEWSVVADAARAASSQLSGPLGYAGFSMGALLGLSIVAELPDVRAAVFALGGVLHDDGLGNTGTAARNVRVRAGARGLGDREVLMLNMTRDEHFPIDGAIEVFEAIPGPKRMGVWAGTHDQIPPEAIVQANAFLARTLA